MDPTTIRPPYAYTPYLVLIAVFPHNRPWVCPLVKMLLIIANPDRPRHDLACHCCGGGGPSRCSTRNTVYEVLKRRPGWVETQDDVDWDLCWADVGWVRDMYDQIQVGLWFACERPAMCLNIVPL